MFRNTLFFKIIMVFTLPALGILYFSSILVYDKINFLDEVYKTEHNIQYMTVTQELIHSIEKERELLVLSTNGKNFAEKLINQKKITDKNYQEYLKVLNNLFSYDTYKNDLEQFIKEFQKDFNSLDILRTEVSNTKRSNIYILHEYTKINKLLLDSISSIKYIKSALNFNNEYSNIFHFLTYKEYTAIEKILLTLLKSAEESDENIKKQLLSTQVIQDHNLDYFKKNSSSKILKIYNDEISNNSSNQIDRFDLVFKKMIIELDDLSKVIQRNASLEQNSSLLFLFVCFVTLISLLFVLKNIIFKEQKAYDKINKQKKVYELLNKTNKYLLKNETKEELYTQINRIISKNSQTVFSFIYDCESDNIDNKIFAKDGFFKNLLVNKLNEFIDLNKNNLLTKSINKNRNILIESFQNENASIFYNYAEKFDIKSAAAFPIRKFDKVVSVLIIYSNENKFFDYEIEILFDKMIGDLTHALEKLDYEKIRLEQEKELKISSVAFESSEPMLITDEKARIVNVNQAFCRGLGYSKEELLGENPRIFKSSHQNNVFYESLWNNLIENDSWNGEVYNVKKNKEIFPVRIAITTIRDRNNNITNYLGQYIDISEQKDQQKVLEYQATHDNLTALPNRLLLLDRIERAITKVIRHNIIGGLIFIDLDNFKNINDTLGHSVGDTLLITVAKKLREVVRDEDTISRIGGDEFVILADNIGSNNYDARKNIEILAKKIKDSLNSIDFIDGFKNISTPSIGVTLFSDDSVSVKDIIKQADTAMYAAKKQGKNTIEYFN